MSMSKLQSDSIDALMSALSKAQGEIKNAIKDSNNPFFKSKYADLSSVKEACQEALTKQGLAVSQSTNIRKDGSLVLITTLGHGSGQYIKGIYPINPVKNDPQGIGSAITYARRYTLAAMVGVIADDDDGEAAQGRASKNNEQKPTPAYKASAIQDKGNEIYIDSPEQKKAIFEMMKGRPAESKPVDFKRELVRKFKDEKYTMRHIESEIYQIQ